MIFKRRARLSWIGRLKVAMVPSKSWRRGFVYIGERMKRLPDTPHRIALGFACGVMASFTPLFALHFIVAAMLALTLRANILASALGTFVGNPLTFPFIAWVALSCSDLFWGYDVDLRSFRLSDVFGDLETFLDTIFVPYLIGGLLPGLAAAVVAYILFRPIVAAYQGRRRERRMAAARDRVGAHLGRMKRGKPVDVTD